MTILFRAKINEGYTVKVLSELLQNVIKTACFVLTRHGITFRMMDSHRQILIDIDLERDNFNIYELHQEKMFLGLNLNHLYKMLKSIKKKDSLCMMVESENPSHLKLIVYPKENNQITTSSIHIQNIQNIDIDVPTGYTHPVLVPSSDYQRTLKDMNNIGNTINIAMKSHSVNISCVANGIYSRSVVFGEFDDETPVRFSENFNIDLFIRIIKLSGISNTIHFYTKENLPLCIKTKVGQLGTIRIFIKSQRQIEQDSI